jgi:hypothetical protein
LTYRPVPHQETCTDCGTALDLAYEGERCPVCFDSYLESIDVGFLENYRKFGCRSRLVVAETCLRGLVTATPEHRKVLAMTIFEQYVQAMNDLAGLFTAFRKRSEAPIIKSFLEFRLDAANAASFFDTVQSITDVELCAALELPLPGQVRYLHPHLDEKDAYSVAVAIYQLVQDLRKATDKGSEGALALARFAGESGGAVLADDGKWLNGAGSSISPDQVAMLVMDPKRRSIYVQGLTADEGAMGRVVDAIDTATRAASNLIYTYLQTNDL